jgi:hypothetical protein
MVDKLSLKGQMESLGLVIVVIIIVIAGTFAIVLINKNKGDNGQESYLTTNANNLRESLLKTELCEQGSIGDEINACNAGESVCFERCNMVELKKKMKNVVEKSIGKELNYEVRVAYSNPDDSFSVLRGECKSKVTSAPQYTLSGAEIKVILCFS